MYAQVPDPGSITIDTHKCIGRFYCEKENYCMYAADLSGYIMKKSLDNSKSTFGLKISAMANYISDNIVCNEIIYMKHKESN